MSRSATSPAIRFVGLTLRIDNDDRIALLGSNGNGKSTLVKLPRRTAGAEHGTVTRAATLKVAFRAAPTRRATTRIEALTIRPRSNAGSTGSQSAREGRRHRFFRPGRHRRGEDFIGGEKARLLMGLATFAAPHLVILDEPTNHLDIDSRAALKSRQSTTIRRGDLVSHDRYLLEACADRLWLVPRAAGWRRSTAISTTTGARYCPEAGDGITVGSKSPARDPGASPPRRRDKRSRPRRCANGFRRPRS